MPDEIRELLRRGAGAPRPSWGFDTVWRRRQRQRTRDVALKSVAAVGIVALGAISVPVIRSNVTADDRGAPAGKATWQPDATWQRIPPAPVKGRYGNVAVWTGEDVLVWGGTPDDAGDSAGLANGAAFDPGARSWRRLDDGPLELTGGRAAVWTGDAMLVWGGEVGDGSHGRPDDGAAYDPRTDSWTELPASPYWSLAGHSATWTGEEMVVWGGVGAAGMEGRGAAFDPGRDAWRTIAAAPLDGRQGHTAVWTGEEVLVWGGRGEDGPLATGAAYDPDTDSWRELPPAPISARDLHAATWTGAEMVVWGGWTEKAAASDGAAYDPVGNTWRELPPAPIEAATLDSSAVWTGNEVIVVGAKGALVAYSPEENEWTTLPDPPMGPTEMPTLVGAGAEAILWGGVAQPGGAASNKGAILRVGE
jgi:N-acetylneuraminic acid mutarotase